MASVWGTYDGQDKVDELAKLRGGVFAISLLSGIASAVASSTAAARRFEEGMMWGL